MSKIIKGVTSNPILTLKEINTDSEKWRRVVGKIKQKKFFKDQSPYFVRPLDGSFVTDMNKLERFFLKMNY